MKGLENPAGDRGGLRSTALGAALLSGLFALYLAARPLAIHVSDSYAWVNTVETEAFGYFFHPHHVLYIALAWRWKQLVGVFLPSVSTWAAMAGLSALFGCAGVAALYRTMITLGARTSAAAAGAAVLAFSFGYWFFSSDAEVYVISAASALWAFYLLSLYLTRGENRFAAWAGVAAGFAALFHQTGIFLFAPAAIVALSSRRGGGVVKPLAGFAGAFLALVAPVYFAAAWASLPALTLTGFVNWLFLFAGKGHGGFSWAALPGAPVGLARAVVGGQAVIDALRAVTAAGAALWVGLAACVVALGHILYLSVRAIGGYREASPHAKTLCVAALAAFGVYGVFSIYFDPANFEWWTIPVAVFCVSAGAAAMCSPRPPVAAAWALAVLLCAANISLDFLHRRTPSNDFLVVAARRVAALTDSRDLIIAPSYLGALIWYENRDRRILCPDEAARKGADAAGDIFLSAALEADAAGGRLVIAGADRDAATSEHARRILSKAAEGEVWEIGRIRFPDGNRRALRTVGEVAVLAVDPAAVIRAFGDVRTAKAEGR